MRYFKRVDDNETRIQIAFTIVNVGTGTASLIGSRVSIEFFKPAKLPTPFYLAGQSIEPRKFEPGATDEYTIPHGERAGVIPAKRAAG